MSNTSAPKLSLAACALTLLAIASACLDSSRPPQAPSRSSSDSQVPAFEPLPIQAREVQLTDKSLTLLDGSELKYQHGIINVPTRRSVAQSRMIPLHFYRFFGPSEGNAPPLFRLRGGPGVRDTGQLLEQPGYAELNTLCLLYTSPSPRDS